MRLLATALCVISVSAIAAIAWWRSANIGPVQRGADLAVAQGCLGCHGGPGVSPLLPRPFADLDDVDRATLREWILDGMPQRVRQDPERRQALEAAAIRMPAWRGRLSHAQVDDLVAYLRALAAADVPEDPEARKGHAVAERLGCFRCHGPGGRGAGPNPGSLKGYIPPWDGPDFAELVLDRRELREWIRDGRPQRLQANPLARFFLDRQAIRMPAFRGQVTEEEHRALEAYMGWLQRGSPATTTSTVQSTQQNVRVERSSTVRDMEQPSGSLVTWTKAIYALHAFSLLTGILGAATVVGAFLTGWPSIIAVILNYVKRGEARGSWIESHFRWQIRTFWFGLLWVVLCVLFVVATLGIGIIIAWLPMGLVGLWFIYRIVRGWVAVSDGRPMYT